MVREVKAPPAKLLVDAESQHEVGFRLPGFILEKDLPPITR